MQIKNSDKKAIQALNYFAIKEGGKINRMKAFKLIWLSDRAHLRKYGRTILGDNYFAMKLGPVPSKTKELSEEKGVSQTHLKKYRDSFIKPDGQYDIDSVNEPELKVFSNSDLDVMDNIYKTFGSKKEFTLSKFSHEFPEWKKFESYFKVNESGNRRMDYADFFTDSPVSLKYFNESEELLKLSKEVFEEGCSIY